MKRILSLLLALLATSAMGTGVDIPAAKNLTGGKSCLYSGATAEVCGVAAGTAPSGNVVGTSITIKTSSTVIVTSATQANPIFGSASIPAGVWLPCVNMRMNYTGTVTINEEPAYGFSTDSGASTWTDVDFVGMTNVAVASLVMGSATPSLTQTRLGATACFPPITVTTPTTYYFKSFNRVTAGELDHNGELTFTRIY